jgi:C-terminal peptidase prc
VATKENILAALKNAVQKAGEEDRIYFAFFGEGASVSGDRRCYFAADSTVKDRDKDAIAATEIEEVIKTLKSKRFVAFVDVDFKGIKNPPPGTPEPTLGANPYQEFLGDDESEDHAPLPGRVVFLATNGLSTSIDLEKHGIFSQVVIDGLSGKADIEGYEPDGHVTVDELADYLDKELPELARQFGKTEEEKRQLHFVLGMRGNHFPLVKNPAATAKHQERLDQFEALVKNGKVPEKFAEEGRNLLDRMPRLKAQQSLRKEYQKLVDGTNALDAFQTAREDILEKTKLHRTDALRYARKVMEVIDTMQSNHVKKLTRGEMVQWALEGLFGRIDEKIPEELGKKLEGAKDLDETELLAILAEFRQHLGKREDLDDEKDLNITLQRMLAKLDPYTTYVDPEMAERFRGEIDSNFYGIGIQIRKDAATDQLLVVTPIKGAPAYRAGLQAGDLITKIILVVDPKGKPLDPPKVLQTKGLPLNDAVKNIKGEEGTPVKLEIHRKGAEKDFVVEIKRGLVDVETVLGHQRAGTDGSDWDFVIDKANKIGYVRLSSFARNTSRDLKKVMEELDKQGVKGLILDLRFNPGGLLSSAVEISDMFIDDGLIVSIKPRVGRGARYSGEREGSMLDFPMVCLVNGFSASGSEIVSAALQDHHRALIMGERSFGKGSVQNIQDFNGGYLKLTTASFWRPSGKNLNKSSTDGKDEDEWGVIPDQLIKLSRTERDDLAEAQRDAEIIYAPGKTPPEKKEFKDRQLDAALEYLRGKIKTASRLDRPKAG